jgi:hypothetical protein
MLLLLLCTVCMMELLLFLVQWLCSTHHKMLIRVWVLPK